MDEYINDVDKDFRLCIKLEKLLSIFYYISAIYNRWQWWFFDTF